MDAFAQAKRRFLVHLRPEDVYEALLGQSDTAPEAPEITVALEQLERWGNLRADPDTSRVTTLHDFYRARFLYQLTPEGEAAERALEEYDRTLGRRGELQAVALEDIRIRLHSLRNQAEATAPDPAIVHGLLRELSSLLEGLAANAGDFMSSLQRTIELQDVDEEAFIAYKDRLLGYLQRFIQDLVVKSAEIATTLRTLEQLGVQRLLGLAAAREATDVAPGDDPAGSDGEAAVEARLGEWRDRWSGLRSWFVDAAAHPAQASLLRQRARSAIPSLLGAVSTIHERRSGRSDRSADFRALARWFAEAPTEGDAHRLWRAAFGLSSSRHLTIDGDTLQAREEQPVPASIRWADAPPVRISPRLRATGSYQKRGPAARLVDREAARRLLAEQLAAERSQLEAVRRRFATGRPIRLRDLGALDQQEFALFLQLLGDALTAGPPGQDGITTFSSDGTLQIELRPLDAASPVDIVTPGGVLRGPDHLLTITDLSQPPSKRATAATEVVRR